MSPSLNFRLCSFCSKVREYTELDRQSVGRLQSKRTKLELEVMRLSALGKSMRLDALHERKKDTS